MISTSALEAASLLWMELAMFAAAAFIYAICIGLPSAKSKKMKGLKLFAGHAEGKDTHRAVMINWREVKKGKGPALNNSELYGVVDTMRQLGKSTAEVVSELRAAVQANGGLKAAVAALPAALLRDDALELLSSTLALLQEFGQDADIPCYAGLMAGQLRRWDFAGVVATATKVPQESFTPRMHAVFATAQAHLGKLDAVLAHLALIPAPAENGRCLLAPSAAAQVLALAAKEGQLPAASQELLRLQSRIEEQQFKDLLTAESRKGVPAKCKELLAAGSALCRMQTKASGYQALAASLAVAADGKGLVSLVEELEKSQEQSQEALTVSLLEACKSVPEEGVKLLPRVLALHRTVCGCGPGGCAHTGVLSAACGIFFASDQASEACDFYKREMMPFLKKGTWPEPALTDMLLQAAAQQDRIELVKCLAEHASALERAQQAAEKAGAKPSIRTGATLAIADPFVQRSLAMMKAMARERDLPGATAVFNRLKESGATLRPQVYNSFLDASVHCNDIEGALRLFEEMKRLCYADVVSYNTILKAFLSSGLMAEARALVKEMSTRGVPANRVTYNELLNAKVIAGDRKGMWSIVEEMMGANVKASFITCSILLKSLTRNSPPWEVERMMDLIDKLEETLEEVLFTSIIEACIRIKQLTMLSDVLRRYKPKGIFKNLAAPTYGTMIKAFGEAGVVSQVRELWSEMQAQNVKPTAITIGCMVEALVINNQGDEALELVHKQMECEDRRKMINTVVYSTVLKGFAVVKNIDKVLAVYQEMRSHGIACNTITYNTMLDACAKLNSMDKASSLLEDMRELRIEPDIITYSTILKGYCLSGDVDRGFHVLEEMKRDGQFSPDEIMYNSLMDGCAKQRRVEDALKILEEMNLAGIKPTNYTLSILVKMLGHSRRLPMAFQMVEDICKENRFRPNVQVYTCLVHACFQNKRLEKALAIHETMVAEGCSVDDKFYAVLAKGCLQNHQPMKAIEVIRAAYRLPGTSLGRPARAVGVDSWTLQEIFSKLRACGQEEKAALDQLSQDLEEQGVNVGSGNSYGYNSRQGASANTHVGPSREWRRGGR